MLCYIANTMAERRPNWLIWNGSPVLVDPQPRRLGPHIEPHIYSTLGCRSPFSVSRNVESHVHRICDSEYSDKGAEYAANDFNWLFVVA